MFNEGNELNFIIKIDTTLIKLSSIDVAVLDINKMVQQASMSQCWTIIKWSSILLLVVLHNKHAVRFKSNELNA